MNSESVAMMMPGPLNDYQLLMQGEHLYAAFIGITGRTQGDLFVSEVDLERFEAAGVQQISQPEGTPVAPQLALVNDDLYLAWLQHLGRGRASRYQLRFGKVSELMGGVKEVRSFDFGMQLYPFRLVPFDGGFLILGLSKNEREEAPIARIFRFTEESGIEEVKSNLISGTARDLAVVTVDSKLLLFRLGEGRVRVFTSEAKGETWKPVREFEAGEAVFVRAASKGERVEVAWGSTGPAGSKIFRVTSTDGGNEWGQPFESPEVTGTNLQMEFAQTPGLGPVLDYEYRDSRSGCRARRLLPLFEGASELKLEEFSPGCRVSLHAFVSSFGDCLVAAWPDPRAREGKVLWAAAPKPQSGWLKSEAESLSAADERNLATFIRLFEYGGHLYLSYFESARPRGGMTPFLKTGDLMLRRLNATDLEFLGKCTVQSQ